MKIHNTKQVKISIQIKSNKKSTKMACVSLAIFLSLFFIFLNRVIASLMHICAFIYIHFVQVANNQLLVCMCVGTIFV